MGKAEEYYNDLIKKYAARYGKTREEIQRKFYLLGLDGCVNDIYILYSERNMNDALEDIDLLISNAEGK